MEADHVAEKHLFAASRARAVIRICRQACNDVVVAVWTAEAGGTGRFAPLFVGEPFQGLVKGTTFVHSKRISDDVTDCFIVRTEFGANVLQGENGCVKNRAA